MKTPDRAPDAETLAHEHYDFDFIKSLCLNVLDFLDAYYFRSRFVGFDPMPARNDPERPLIYISNHSGMAFPWDAITFSGSLLRMNSFSMEKSARALTAPALSASPFMAPYFIKNFWKRAGGIDATMPNFDAMMSYTGANLLVYPEGLAGIGKGFADRYRMQRFSTSFIRMAIKYRTDVIPISVVNGEFINPYGYRNDDLNKLVQKIGMPYLPVGPLTALVPFQPWAFYFGMPAKLTYVLGERIKVYEMTDKPLEKIKKKELHRIRDTVQRKMQAELDRALDHYGRDPYELEELGDLWRENLDKLAYILPSGWPLLFHEHERLFTEYRANGGADRSDQSVAVKMSHDNVSFLGALARNPNLLAYHIPIAGIGMLLNQQGI